jgi:pimeloyl-ACP methyl ester carboxylesterase
MPNSGETLVIGFAAVLAIYFFTSKKPKPIPQLGSIINKQHIYYKPKENQEILIVFCHGLGGHIPQFEYQLKELEKYYSVLAIEYTGHGKTFGSDNMDDYTAASFAKQVSDAIKANECPGQKIVLVGHSYGCIVSLTLANHHKDLDIAGLVLLAPFGFIDEPQLAKFQKLGRLPTAFLNFYRSIVDRFGGLNSISVRRAFGKNVSEQVKERQYSYNCSTKTETVKKTLAATTLFSEEEYRDIKMPVMIISGALDTLSKLGEHGARMKSLISPDCLKDEHFIVFPTAGHLVTMEEPDQVNSSIKAFISAISK